jgi:hypothetical protein
MKHQRAFCVFDRLPNSRNPARKPQIVLMKKAGPIASRFTQAEIGSVHPIPYPAVGY